MAAILYRLPSFVSWLWIAGSTRLLRSDLALGMNRVSIAALFFVLPGESVLLGASTDEDGAQPWG